MATNTLSVRYQLRHDIESEFTTKNPILLSGEVAIAYASEGTKVKIGENKAFNDTPYVTDFSKSSISAYGHLLSSLTIQYIELEEYYRLVSTNNGEGIDPNTLYILSGTYSNNFGELIKNVADPTDEYDAATKRYVDLEITNLSDEYQPKGNYLTSHQSLDNYYTKTLVNSISSYLNELINSHESTPLTGKTYDLSQNGMFTKLVVDVGRALGATITNSPVDGLLAASIVDGDEMRFGN